MPERSGATSLFELLNLNPRDKKSLSNYNDGAILEAFHRDPMAAKTKYKFSAYFGDLYPLFMAVALGASLEVVRPLYNACHEAIEFTDRDGWAPLHFACQYKSPLEVALFLAEKYPPAIEMKDRYGMTPLHLACFYGAPMEVVEMLVERCSAALDIEDIDGNTPLMCAKLYNASPEVITLLTASTPSSRSMTT